MDRQRSELSKKSKYWIEKHRFYELRHYCMQYPYWKKMSRRIDGWAKTDISTVSSGMISKPTETAAIEASEYHLKINQIESCCKEAAGDLWEYLLKGVTQGIGYNYLNPPCCKDVYYDVFRKFFYILSKARN